MKITEDHQLHAVHYLSLIVVLNVGVGAFLFFGYNFLYQVIALVLTSVAYIVWGIIHHWMADDLHPRVILEYIVIALLADVVILTMVMRA